MLKYLPFIFSKVVQPMREEIRLMMFEMHIASESDIIGTSCQFMQIVFPKYDYFEIKESINYRVMELCEKYQEIIQSYCEDHNLEDTSKEESKSNNCKQNKIPKVLDDALKFCSYFDISHISQKIFRPLIKDDNFKEMVKMMRAEEYKLYNDVEFLPFQHYKKILSSCMNEENELSRIIYSLKLFSPWWILTNG